jgi:hypothetical protein
MTLPTVEPPQDPTRQIADADRVRLLFDAQATGRRGTETGAALRSRLTSELVGSEITLPAEVPLWQHVNQDSRELYRTPYDGSALVVHNTEPAGASFLVYGEDGHPHSRRGPAVTLHRPEDAGHDTLLVVFSADLGN